MKVELVIYGTTGFECDCSMERCKYTRTCANHVTAGDFRSEDGFSPEIRQVDAEFFCDTADRPVDWERSYGDFDTHPHFGADFPGFGCIGLKDVKRESSDDYQI